MSRGGLLFTRDEIVGHKMCKRDMVECGKASDAGPGSVGSEGVVERGQGDGMGQGGGVPIQGVNVTRDNCQLRGHSFCGTPRSGQKQMSAKTTSADQISLAGRTVPTTKTGARGKHSPQANPYRSNVHVASAQHSYSSDPKYKKYTQQVEKCLNAFDNVHEWADCIAFLRQLLKVCIYADNTLHPSDGLR